MRFRSIVTSAIVLLVLGVTLECATALVDKQVGAFGDGQTFEYAIGLATASDKNPKTAAIIIAGSDRTKFEYKPRAIFFDSEAKWNQLVSLWQKARVTRPLKRTNINGNSIDIGNYFDGDALITVSVNDDATVSLDLVDKDKWPMLFRLRPEDFDGFDSAVKKVSAYFAQ